MNEVVINSFLAGALQTFIGHPFDTVKTLKQTNINLSYNQIRNNILSKGYGKFYSGYIPMLLGGCVQNSSMFSIEYYIKRNIKGDNDFLSGFLAGSIGSLFLSPCELIKCRLQTNSINKFKLSNIFRGLHLTFLRDSIGLGIYFSSYRFLKEKNDNALINGGLAGAMSWVYSYPIDTVKTVYQLNNNLKVKDIIIKYKYNLLKGFDIILVRSFLVNAGIFYVYEYLGN